MLCDLTIVIKGWAHFFGLILYILAYAAAFTVTKK